MEEVLEQLSALNKSIAVITARLVQIDGNIVDINQRFEKVDDRFTDIDSNFAEIYRSSNSMKNKRLFSSEKEIGENSKATSRRNPPNASSVNIAFDNAAGDGIALREIALIPNGENVSYFHTVNQFKSINKICCLFDL